MWTELVLKRSKGPGLVNTVTKLQAPWYGNFIDQLNDYQLLKYNSPSWSQLHSREISSYNDGDCDNDINV